MSLSKREFMQVLAAGKLVEAGKTYKVACWAPVPKRLPRQATSRCGTCWKAG